MIVVSDTSPLNYLVVLDRLDVLPKLYGRVFIPRAVADELLAHPNTPAVRQLVLTPPPWLIVRSTSLADQTLDALDRGEREAIALVEELNADLLLCDDRRARLAAEARSIRVAGTLAVLEEAATARLLNLRETLEQLRTTTNFRVSQALIHRILELHERKQSP